MVSPPDSIAEIEQTNDADQHLDSTIRALAKGLGMTGPEVLTEMWAKHQQQQASDTTPEPNLLHIREPPVQKDGYVEEVVRTYEVVEDDAVAEEQQDAPKKARRKRKLG